MTAPNTNPLTWNSFVQQVAVLAVEDVALVSGVMTGSNPQFNIALQTAISYAENRIERDLDLLSLETVRYYSLTPGNNILQISPNDFVTIRTLEANGAALLGVSKEYIQNVFPSGSAQSAPTVFAMYGGDLATGGSTFTNILFGPPPDASYGVTVTGTIRMPSLYLTAVSPTAATATTWISVNLPDLLIQAAMIPISEYQRQFSAVSNDPQMPGVFEAQYQSLLTGVRTEIQRFRLAASAWSAAAPAPIATPNR